MRRALFLALVAALVLAPARGRAADVPDAATIRDAWTYLIARAFVVRQEQMDRAEPGFAFNTVKYNPLGAANFVNPNFDVAYLEGWIAVDDHSHTVLEVPEITGRYYTAQILDEWGEVIANVNERTMPTKPSGRFALVAPGAEPDLPGDMGRIVLHSGKAKLLGRVELKTDPDAAVALQHGFTLTPSGTPAVAEPPPLPAFDNTALIGVELFDHAGPLLASAPDVSPHAAAMQEKVRAVAEAAADPAKRENIAAEIAALIPAFQRDAITKSAPTRDGWTGGAEAGNYGTDYFLRASVNYAGIWANTTDEVIYFVASHGPDGKPLDGGSHYTMRFPADRLPDAVVDGYWSVILVGVPDYRVVDNTLQRYNFNTYSPLTRAADGSLTLGVGPTPPAGVPDSNWLPSAPGKPFSLTFRTYVPKDVVKSGGWQPAAVTPAP